MPPRDSRKPDALKESLTIPVTSDLLRRLKKQADKLGATMTGMARSLIEQGLGGEKETRK